MGFQACWLLLLSMSLTNATFHRFRRALQYKSNAFVILTNETNQENDKDSDPRGACLSSVS